MLLVVTGGRDFKHVEYIYAQLDKLHMQRRITTLRHGNADGVDRICAHWAERNGIKTEAFPAPWDNLSLPNTKIRYNAKGAYNAQAGAYRNQLMLDTNPKPDHAIVFPGGAGTMDMYRRIKVSGIPYTLVE